MITMRPVFTASLAGALLLACPPASVATDHGPQPRTIRATGQSTVKAAPDRVRVAVSVTTRAASAREASEQNARTSKTVLEQLRASVKAPGEVRTAGYDLSPEYDYEQPRRAGQGPTLVGYAATNRLAIVSADLAGVGALIDAAVAAGANQIDSISFFLDDEASARRQALLQAGQVARNEAETIAQSLGVGVGDVLDASSGATVGPQPIFARDRGAMMMEATTARTEVVPGSVEIQASVSVTFAIR